MRQLLQLELSDRTSWQAALHLFVYILESVMTEGITAGQPKAFDIS